MSSEPSTALPLGYELTSLDEAFRNDPSGAYNKLRKAGPLVWDGVLRDHIVVRADLGRTVLTDPALLTDPRAAHPASRRHVRGEDLSKDPPMSFADNPRHRRIRSLLNLAGPRTMFEALRPTMRQLVHELLDGVAEDEFDFMQRIARPLPTIVVARLLGVDPARQEEFKIWSDEIIEAKLNPMATPEMRAAGDIAEIRMAELFRTEIAVRRQAPRDDLVNAMMSAQLDNGERYTDEEVVEQCQFVLIAGNQTTTDFMGNMLHLLLTTPGAYQEICRDRALIPRAIEEGLRFNPPILSTDRFAPADMELQGCPVAKGQMITVMLAATNHDPAMHDDPEAFDLHRTRTGHFAFGGGRHSCWGAPLARIETQELLSTLVDRFPNLRATEHPAEWMLSPGFRGLARFIVSKGTA